MPIFTTERGLEVTAESEKAAGAVQDFETNLLGLTKGLDDAPANAEKFPETLMTQACAATYFIYAQDEANLTTAEGFLQKAESLSKGATPREQSYVSALRLFHGKHFQEALATLELHTGQWPRDLLAAKVSEFLYYTLGQHHCGLRFRDHMERLEKSNSESAGYWSMCSFATELCGDYHTAQDEAERSLSLDENQPWAQHTLAHITSRRGKGLHGIAYMEEALPLWRQANRGIHSHNAWHLALMYLDQMKLEKIHALLKSDLWGIMPDAVFEQLDTIALLWRLDLAGEPAPDNLWAEVAAKAEAHAGQCFIPFIDGHLVYALARAGNTDAAMAAVQKARLRAEADDVEARDVWAPVGADFVAACADFGAGKFREAVTQLMPVAGLIPMVGGSDAQDDLFRLALIHGLNQLGDSADAHTLWDRFYGDKWRTAFDDRVLA